MQQKEFERAARSGLWGLIVGGATGFVIGMLMAPEDGRKIRRRLAYQLEHWSQKIGDNLHDFLDPSNSESDARKRGDDLVAAAEQRAQQIGADIDALLGEMRQSRATEKHGTN